MSYLVKQKCAICGKEGICGIRSLSISGAVKGAKMCGKINMKASPYVKDCICDNHSEKDEFAFWDEKRKLLKVLG